MKKNYFLAALFTFAMVSMNAQFTDDMESYTDGQPIFQDHWTDWGCGGGAGCAIMASSAQARSGSLSGLIPDDGTTDAVLDMGNKIFGEWGLEFYMYIPSGQEAYFNLQGTVPIGAGEWSVGNIFFNEANGDPGVGYIDYGPNTTGDETFFNFAHDTWIRVVMNFDITGGMSAATWQFSVDNNVVVDGVPFQDEDGNVPTSLGGIDYFSISSTNLYYMDDFAYADSPFPLTLSIEDLEAKGFAAYPNPVNDVLNLRANEEISSVEIYNVLGQKVYSATVDALTTTVDMSRFDNGAYFVKAVVGNTEGTVKVLK